MMLYVTLSIKCMLIVKKWTQNSPTKRQSPMVLCVPLYKSFTIQRKENVQKQKQFFQSKVTAYTCPQSSCSFKLIYGTDSVSIQVKCAYPLTTGVFKPVSCIFVHAAAARASGPLTVCCWSSLAGGWSAVTPPGRRLTLKVTPIYVLNAIRHCKYMRRHQNKITRHVSDAYLH